MSADNDTRNIVARVKALLDAMPALGMDLSPEVRRAVQQAARLQETIIVIAHATGHAPTQIERELRDWVESLVFPYNEMLPIARKNVKAALPMTRLPLFKKLEIETGSKYVPNGMGRTWEDVIPFEW
jgi:hypothetical protein